MRSTKSVLIWLLAVLLFYLILRATVAIGLSPPESLVQAARDTQCINAVGAAPYAQHIADSYTVFVSHPPCALGAPDGATANIGRDRESQLVLDVGQGNEFVDGESYDLYFFEGLNAQGTGISLDRVRIAVADSVDGQPGEFTPDVFVWGDTDSTNNGSLTITGTEEIDRDVPLDQLIREDRYGAIGIDLAGKVPAGKVFRYIRIRAFEYGKVVDTNRLAQVDAFEVTHPLSPTAPPETPTTVPLSETLTSEPTTPVALATPPDSTATDTPISEPTETSTVPSETVVVPTVTDPPIPPSESPGIPVLTPTATLMYTPTKTETPSLTATLFPSSTQTVSPDPTATPNTPTATTTLASDTVTPLLSTLPPHPPSPTQKPQDAPTFAAPTPVAVAPSATSVPTIAVATAIEPNITLAPTSTNTAFALPVPTVIVASDASPTTSLLATTSPTPVSPTNEATRTSVTTKVDDVSATTQAANAAPTVLATDMMPTQTAVAEGATTATAENGLASKTRNVFQQYSLIRKTKSWVRNASNAAGVIIELFLGGLWVSSP